MVIWGRIGGMGLRFLQGRAGNRKGYVWLVRATALILWGITVFGFCGRTRAQEAKTPQKWALLIGIDEYADRNHLNRLGGAAADARALARTLTDIADFPEDHVHLLVSDADARRGEQTPERSAILHELALLADKVKPGDLVVVAYSGHGLEIDEKPCLLPYDTDASSLTGMTDTVIPVERFMERLGKVKAGTLLLIFDMCRSDPKKGAKDITGANTLKERQTKAFKLGGESDGGEKPTVITLFACSRDQRSWEWGEKRRGYFSYFLDEGLRGKAADASGTVRFDRLMQYIGDNVEKTVLREEDKTQTPFFEVQGPAGAEAKLTLARNVVYAAPLTLTEAKTEKVETEASFRLRVSPPEATITVDSELVSENFVRIDLGVERERTVKIAVSAPGYRSEERTVNLKRGSNLPVSFSLDSLGGGPTAGVSASGTAASGRPASRRQRRTDSHRRVWGDPGDSGRASTTNRQRRRGDSATPDDRRGRGIAGDRQRSFPAK